MAAPCPGIRASPTGAGSSRASRECFGGPRNSDGSNPSGTPVRESPMVSTGAGSAARNATRILQPNSLSLASSRPRTGWSGLALPARRQRRGRGAIPAGPSRLDHARRALTFDGFPTPVCRRGHSARAPRKNSLQPLFVCFHSHELARPPARVTMGLKQRLRSVRAIDARVNAFPSSRGAPSRLRIS